MIGKQYPAEMRTYRDQKTGREVMQLTIHVIRPSVGIVNGFFSPPTGMANVICI